MPIAHEAVLALRGLSFSYGGADVFKDLELEVAPGEIAFLFGSNGAGKSTLLRCVAGWSAPTQGVVELLGRSLRDADRHLRRRVVLVTDTPPFYDDLTAREHLRFVLRANHLRDGESEAERLLGVFGLSGVADAYPSTYSRGMRYKLALAIALLVRPSLLLLDEPFGPIDAAAARVLWDELRALTATGSSVLASVHGMPDVEPDRSYVLDEGTLTACALNGHSDA